MINSVSYNNEGTGSWIIKHMIPKITLQLRRRRMMGGVWKIYLQHIKSLGKRKSVDIFQTAVANQMIIHFEIIKYELKRYTFTGDSRLNILLSTVKRCRLFPLVERDFPVGKACTQRLGKRQAGTGNPTGRLGTIMNRYHEIRLLLLYLPCREQTWFKTIESKFISTGQAGSTKEAAELTSLAKSTSNSKSAKGVENPKNIIIPLWWDDRVHITVFGETTGSWKQLWVASSWTYAPHPHDHHTRVQEQGMRRISRNIILSISLGGTLRMSYKVNLPDTSPHSLLYSTNACKVLKQAGYQGKTSRKREIGMGIGVACVKSIGNGGKTSVTNCGRTPQGRTMDSSNGCIQCSNILIFP